jgi:hypothetical protein
VSDDLAGRVVEAASQTPGVASVTPPVFNEDRELAVFVVTPTTAPQDRGDLSAAVPAARDRPP